MREQREFDLERDRMQRKFIAAMVGVKLADNPKAGQSSTGDQQQSLTRRELMRNYKQQHD
jgi:hypothetical protein